MTTAGSIQSPAGRELNRNSRNAGARIAMESQQSAVCSLQPQLLHLSPTLTAAED